MKKSHLIFLVVLLLISIYIIDNMPYNVKGCMKHNVLKDYLNNDIILFSNSNLPPEAINELGDYQLIMLGEHHYIYEYVDFLPNIFIQLSEEKEFNTLLYENPQSMSWVFEDYVKGDLPIFSVEQKKRYLTNLINLDIIRDYNVNKTDKLTVKTIDINHSKQYFINSLKLMQSIIDKGLLTILIEDCLNNNGDKYIKILESYQQRLESPEFADLLSVKWQCRLVDLLKTEIVSEKCRTLLQEGKVLERYQLREEYLKKHIEDKIQSNPGKYLLNMGANHIQKSRVIGSKLKWTGEYLSKESELLKDKTVVVYISFKEGSNRYGEYNLAKSKRKNNLKKILANVQGENPIYLSFNNSPYNSENIDFYDYEGVEPFILNDTYDAIIQLPHATFMTEYQNSYIKKK